MYLWTSFKFAEDISNNFAIFKTIISEERHIFAIFWQKRSSWTAEWGGQGAPHPQHLKETDTVHTKRPTQSARSSGRDRLWTLNSLQTEEKRREQSTRIFKERTMIRPMFLSSSLILVATAAAADPLYFGEFLSLVMFYKRDLILKIRNGKFVHNFLSTKN